MASDAVQNPNDDIVKDFVPREYQVEILEKALRENVIVYLPTGSGKTFIAVMLIKHYLDQLQRKYSEGGKRVFFLVNTTPLVKQQADAVRNLLPLEVGEYSGEKGVDFWDGDRWQTEQDKFQVLVMTAQIYLDMVNHVYTKPQQACLLIFDECHHAVHKHAMRQIMQRLDELTLLIKPKILGLTATLLNCNVSPAKVQVEIETLERTFSARVVRALNHEMVLRYSTNPSENVIFYEEPNDPPPFCHLIDKFICKTDDILKKIYLPELDIKPTEQPPNAVLLNDPECKPLRRAQLSLRDARKISEELGLFGADVSLLSLIILIERFKMNNQDTVYRVLCTMATGIHLLRKQLSRIKEQSKSNDPLFLASNKVIKLAELLAEFPENYRSIVFVDRRSTAHALHHIFTALSSTSAFKNIRSDYIVGINQGGNQVSWENLLSRKKNEAIMKKFNSGDLNIVFASNVIEEGVDVRACNLVIKFDMPTTFTSYTQSKGRARHKLSKYIVIAQRPKPEDKRSIHNCYAQFQSVENCLKTILCDDRRTREESPQDDDDDDVAHKFSNEHGASITALQSISMINRYCSILPHDKFSKLTPLWWAKEVVENGVKKYIAYLKLPVNCPIKTTVEGIPRKSTDSAKRLAALEACRMLYEMGEFDSHLLPLGSKSTLYNDRDFFPQWSDEYINIKLSKKMRQKRLLFDKHYSKWECNCKPKENADVYMHVIKITPNYSYPDTARLQAFYNLLLNDSTFCILTTCPWPELPNFPLFMNVGEVKISLLENNNILSFSASNIDDLMRFHELLFTDALNLVQKYSVISNENDTVDDYIIAPVIMSNGSYTIDWPTVQNQGKFPEIKPKPYEKRLDEPVTDDSYLMKVVVPWYRIENSNLKYIVSKVRYDLNPDSPFPSSNFKSYSEYFFTKYNQKIYDKTQPLLEVRAISSKINCLLPRPKYHSSKKHKKDDDGFEETLVPELCYLLTFPSWYMLKVTVLPSALHRIHHLLITEEFRQTIAEQIQLGSLTLNHDAKWKDLEIDRRSKLGEEEESPFGSDGMDLLYAATSLCADSEESPPVAPEDQEPLDINRSLDVDLTAVLHYNKFISKPVTDADLTVDTCISKQASMKYVEPLKVIQGNYPGYGPEIVHVMTALTAASSNDGFNYERDELLGDSFLKFAASLALFTFFPNMDEGKLSSVKGKIIGNKNLFFCGKSIKLPGILKVNPFDHMDWKVPGFSLSPKVKPFVEDPNLYSTILGRLALEESQQDGAEISESTISSALKEFEESIGNSSRDDDLEPSSSDEESPCLRKVSKVASKDEYSLKHFVREKVISDSVEALLSVYVQNFGIEGGFKLLFWLSVIPESRCDIETMLYFEPISPLINASNDEFRSLIPNIKELESSLGYKFKNKAFAVQALSHSSYPHNITDCYQRYEFLGDAILDFLITAYIFETCKDMSPGDLTDLRSALVNNVTFACLAVRHNFHRHLISRACKLTDVISKFVKHQQNRKHEIGSQVFFLIEESEADINIAECVDVPKVLGDIFESLIAAVYLDSNRDLNRVWTVIFNIMENEIVEFSKNIPKNSIRVMFEKFATHRPKFGKPESKDGTVMIPLEIIHDGKAKIFHGIGENKGFAKVAAAKHALRYFK